MAETVDLSLVLPVYNEEALLERTVAASLAKLERHGSAEVVIVDDAGRDATGEIADRLAAADPRVRVVHNLVNLGVGIGLLRGFRVARGEVVLHNGADSPFDLDDLGTALELLRDADIAVAVRVDRSAHSPWRKLTSLGNRTLIRLLFRTRVRDMNFVQVYRGAVLRDPRVAAVIARSPAFVTPEILLRAERLGYRIAEFPAVFHRRRAGKASYGRPHDILWTFYDMVRFRLVASRVAPRP